MKIAALTLLLASASANDANLRGMVKSNLVAAGDSAVDHGFCDTKHVMTTSDCEELAKALVNASPPFWSNEMKEIPAVVKAWEATATPINPRAGYVPVQGPLAHHCMVIARRASN